MEKFYLEKPTLKRKNDAIRYITEILNNNSDTDGTNKLKYYINNYEDWIIKIENDENIIPSEVAVPSKTYFLIRESDNKIIGMTNIRLVLNEMLKDLGGHIGYSICPSERKKGYNKIQLYLALIECKKNNLDIIMLDCLKENEASWKTIKALGGYLVKEQVKKYHNKNVIVQDYNINVDESINKYQSVYESMISSQYLSTQQDEINISRKK